MSTDSQQPHSDDTTAPNDTSNADEDGPDTEPAAFTATVNVGYVQRFLDAIRALDDKCRLRVAPGGVSARVVGPQNAAMAEARLGTNAFEFYDTDGESGVIGVSTKRLREIVRMSSNRDLMQFDLSDTGQTLRVRAGALDCSLQLTDPTTIRSTSGLDNEEYPSVVVLEGGELKRIVKAASHVDSTVEFRVDSRTRIAEFHRHSPVQLFDRITHSP